MGRPYVTQCEELIRAEAFELGRQEGRREGFVKGGVEVLVDVVRARYGDGTHDVVSAIQACKEPDDVRRWLRLVCKFDLELLRREARG